ncbi:hypothetical protein EI427_12995 [Flammeovirga pectinis]|uniref:Uncharacterized protein n=1 Tax=Flammeovirga pectinis TaxID=2494373 RepID=A0A3Q9FPR5_9BACT|nr:hypothetical protein [Flammeovirga pectinis]AZQ63122.1 hypothetical protein EI427_12995 [Flammeovirga pectinis]
MKASSNIILTIFVFTIISCDSKKETGLVQGTHQYKEKKLSFFDPNETIFRDGKYQGYSYEKWLRKPQNLRMVHETLKKVGYDKLIDDYDLTSNPNLLWGYVNRPLNETIDSLLITYDLKDIESKYYREFWARRKSEGNKKVVFEITKELSKLLIKGQPVKYDGNMVNDTLYNLIKIKERNSTPSMDQAKWDFDYLKSIGLHGSAYNLLFENYFYQDISWDKQELLNELELDSINHRSRFWIEDDTK